MKNKTVSTKQTKPLKMAEGKKIPKGAARTYLSTDGAGGAHVIMTVHNGSLSDGKKPNSRTRRQCAPKKTEPASKKLRPNPFVGADDLYVTKNKIAVVRTTKQSGKRGYKKQTATKYYEQNAGNMRQLKTASGGTVRVGRTGNKYRSL